MNYTVLREHRVMTSTALDKVEAQERSLKREIKSRQIWGGKEVSQGCQLTEEKSRQMGQEG